MSARKRGRPRREYNIRVRAERRLTVDYPKLAQALLEHAAMEEEARLAQSTGDSSVADTKTSSGEVN